MSAPFSELEFVRDRDRSATFNMALDQALLETSTRPTLRVYGWECPSLSFGYFVRYLDAHAEGNGRVLVRRWTGGGIVFHGEDLTYSLVVPAHHAHFEYSPLMIYQLVHEALRAALTRLDLQTHLAGETRPKQSEACFASPVRFDLLCKGKKVAGAAQRRTRRGLLQQGSVQIRADHNEVSNAFAESLAANVLPVEIPSTTVELARRFEANRYVTEAWQKRR